jgi:hypothetical protein
MIKQIQEQSDEPIDEDVKILMDDNLIDVEQAEKIQELMDRHGLDECEALEISEWN